MKSQAPSGKPEPMSNPRPPTACTAPPRGHCYAGDPTAIHVQSAEGNAMSVIDTPDALDAALASCNRKGNREKALINALKRDQTRLRDQLQAGMPRGVRRGVSGTLPHQVEHSSGEEVSKADQFTIQV